MKKAICLILILLMAMPFLFAFHGKQNLDPFEMPAEFDTSKEYNITFWAKNDTNKTQVEIYEKAIADFEALYPNIHVTMRKFTDYAKIYNDVITNYKTRQCNYNDNEECDMLDEKADSLNKSLENLKQKTTSFFANNKDATFFEDNSVEEKLSDVYLSLSTGMVVENETKD